MSPIEVRLRRINPWRLAVLWVAVLAFVYWVLGYLPLIFWIIAPILLITLAYRAIRGQETGPVIIFDEQGVFDKRLKVGVIRWPDIRRITSHSISGVAYISLELHDMKTYESRRPIGLRWLYKTQRIFGMSPIAIMTNHLDLDHDTLFQMIHQGCGGTASKPRTYEM